MKTNSAYFVIVVNEKRSRKEREKEQNGREQNITPPGYGGGEGLLQICGRALPEAGTSGRRQSVQSPELCEERGQGREGSQVQQSGGPKE